MIAMLKMLLDAMAMQLAGTVEEIDERDYIAVCKVQMLLQLMAEVTNAIIEAKKSKGTPADNRQLLHKLDAQFEALERSTRAMASRAVRGADVKNAIVAGALAQLRAVEWAVIDEKSEAA